ncbi:MAG TPA: septal ring lytic transglycosylase RlpA family protein [Rhodocyclaceae bacterium]|nr:septal ring lytic transglycosylase RlpA family protein [Rhodocyclaceae bacterium]
MASFYGYGFQGRLVANGERFDVRGMTAASNRVPLGTWVAVRREDSGRCIVVKVNDRMHAKHKIRVIDLSRGAAERLRMIAAGVVMVRVVPLKAEPAGDAEAVCQSLFAAMPDEGCPACVEPASPPSLPSFDGYPAEPGPVQP